MAIQFVGYATATDSAVPSSLPLTSLTGGIDIAAREGDLVLVTIGYGSNVDENGFYLPLPDDNNYTILVDGIREIDSRISELYVGYKIMGATPDTAIQYWGVNTGFFGQAVVGLVFRGVDQTTPIDVTTTTAQGSNSSHADSPSITPTTSGAWIVACGTCTGDLTPADKTGPSNMSNFVQTKDSNNVVYYSCVTGMDYKDDWTSGAFDPAAWTGGESTTSDAWTAATVVLRPAAVVSSQDYVSIVVNT